MKVLLGIVLVVILVSGFIRAKNTGDIFNPKKKKNKKKKKK